MTDSLSRLTSTFSFSEPDSASLQDSVFKSVPYEVALEIFSQLLPRELVTVRLVCRKWRQISSSSFNPYYDAIKSTRELLLNCYERWASFGDVGPMPMISMDLVEQLTETLNRTCPFSSDESVKIRDTHTFFFMPCELNGSTLNLREVLVNIRDKLLEKRNNLNHSVCPLLYNQFKSKCLDHPYFFLFPNIPVLESKDKKPQEMKLLLETYKNYTFPRITEVLVWLSFNLIELTEKPFFTYCEEMVRNEQNQLCPTFVRLDPDLHFVIYDYIPSKNTSLFAVLRYIPKALP